MWDKEKQLLECRQCFSLLNYTNFYPDTKSYSGFSYWCKECTNKNARKNHSLKRATDPTFKEKRRDQLIKRNHGISLQKYLEKLAQQNHLCAICRVKLPTQGRATHLDHDHKTGKLRDFLCTNCNRGLGHFKDSPELLRSAAKYLDTHNSSVDTIKEVYVNDNCSH